MTPKDVIKLSKEKGCKVLDLRFMDFPGMWQNTSYPIGELSEESFDEGFGFDGSSIRGWQAINESDMLLMPQPETAFIDPFLLETTLLGMSSGLLGGSAGAGLIHYLGTTGIPAAGKDILIFLFAGPRLFPTVGPTQLALGFGAVLFVSVASTIYPAMIATRVQPIVAMQTKE